MTAHKSGKVYTVEYVCTGNGALAFGGDTFFWHCDAKDEDHAREQFLAAKTAAWAHLAENIVSVYRVVWPIRPQEFVDK